MLVDGERWINESWQIARYLDEKFPDKPALMATPTAKAGARFLNFWADTTLHPALRPLIMLSVFEVTAEKDKAYFRKSREELFGKPLEQLCPDRAAAKDNLLKVLTPVESTLKEFAFLGGDEPNYSDYIVFGSLQWANVVAPDPVLTPGSAVANWFERMLDLWGGYARRSPTVAKQSAG
ncbi:MAG: glutathione S-transferase family protein [Rhodomicrobium sp.]|nr:glutathione S-transferase family protein [Rhodomicrobium sp.]